MTLKIIPANGDTLLFLSGERREGLCSESLDRLISCIHDLG